MNGDLEKVGGRGSLSTSAGGLGGRSAAEHQRLERWIDTLEDLVRIPGTRLTFGLDVILGLLPVIGDFAGLLCGLPLLAAAFKRRLPLRVQLVMVANLLIDAVFGAVPILGNVFDLLWKGHRKNLTLLARPDEVGVVLREARGKASALVAIVLLLAAAMVALLVFLVWALLRLPSGLG